MEEDFAYKNIHEGESEMRYDLLRDEWVIIAKARGKRPHDFVPEVQEDVYDEQQDVFADPDASGQEPDTLIYRDDHGEWTTRVFPNKYPAVVADHEILDVSDGPFPAFTATGVHEVLVTRDGRRTFALLDVMELAEVIDAYHERYLDLMHHKNIRSITIFHNHGPSAGGSLMHPHSQILALPIVPSLINHELIATERYFRRNARNLFDTMRTYEQEKGVRIVYENDDFVVYCPFASSRAFGMRIVPKVTQPYFERITTSQKITLADALKNALYTLYDGLHDPDFNFYMHSAPCTGRVYPEYSYFFDVFPRTHVYAGFEFATDTEIVPFAPEDAAAFLREHLL